MSFGDNIKKGLEDSFRGRNGVDTLSSNLFVTALVLMFADAILKTGILSIVSLAMYVAALFRMFSRKIDKRRAENMRFEQWKNTRTTAIRQFFVRLKNSRKYKYFKCPQCKSRLRMPRGVGEKTITCSQCKNSFKQKA